MRDEPIGFGLWLRRGLHQQFDGVLREPVPAELALLVEMSAN